MKTNKPSVSNQRDIIKRKKRLKNELKLIIFKSFIQNRKIKPIVRYFIKIKNMQILKKEQSFSRQQNICVYSGKNKTTFKISSLSRQLTKRFIENGMIQSIRYK